MSEQIAGTKAVAQRIANAEANFAEICAAYGFTADEAAIIRREFVRAKAITLDAVGGRYHFTHGIYNNPDVMENALALATGKEI